jgi:hypothetical protein
MVRIFALGAESLAAVYTEEDTIIAFRRFTIVAVAEMIPLGKVVTVSAANLANLGHFAVCALLLGASRHASTYLPKSRTMVFTKASMQAKDFGKLLYLHESTHASSVQKAEHRAAHEILRKHLGEKHRWRRILLLRLLSTLFLRFHSSHDDGG